MVKEIWKLQNKIKSIEVARLRKIQKSLDLSLRLEKCLIKTNRDQTVADRNNNKLMQIYEEVNLLY